MKVKYNLIIGKYINQSPQTNMQDRTNYSSSEQEWEKIKPDKDHSMNLPQDGLVEKKCHNYYNNTLTFCSSKVQPKPQ